MARKLPTPIPQSVRNGIARVFSGGVLDIVWKLFVIVLLVVGAVALAQLGIVGAFIAGAILTTLLQDDVRRFVGDLWHRRFAEIEVPTPWRRWR